MSFSASPVSTTFESMRFERVPWPAVSPICWLFGPLLFRTQCLRRTPPCFRRLRQLIDLRILLIPSPACLPRNLPAVPCLRLDLVPLCVPLRHRARNGPRRRKIAWGIHALVARVHKPPDRRKRQVKGKYMCVRFLCSAFRYPFRIASK